MKLISVLPGILTIEFCLLNLTHCSCSLRIISLAECGKWDVTSAKPFTTCGLVRLRWAQVVAQNRLPFTPIINCSLTCMSLHVDQAYQRYSVGICRCTTNVMCSVHSRLHLKVWMISWCIRHKVNSAWMMVTTKWLLAPQSTELLLIPLAVWTHGEQLMGFCPANEIKSVCSLVPERKSNGEWMLSVHSVWLWERVKYYWPLARAGHHKSYWCVSGWGGAMGSNMYTHCPGS